jgi:hypothetical protein
MSWMLSRGPVPHGLFVLHRCDVKKCVNPEHLFLGTQKDNMDDCAAKGRRKWLRGADIGMSKLSSEDVALMRKLRSEGKLQKDLAQMFHISPKQVSVIVRGIQWAHIPMTPGTIRESGDDR